MQTRRVFALLALLLPVSAGAAAQSQSSVPRSAERPVPRASSLLIGGVLAADSTSTPIVGAEVILEDLGLRTQSDEAGNYSLANIPTGTHPVLVRQWGFTVSRARVTFNGADTVAHLVVLHPITLPGMTVRAAAPRDPRDADLESRKARAAMNGHLVDRALLDRLPGRRLSAVITRAPGVKLALVNGKYVATSTRGAITMSSRRPCLMRVYVDGVVVTGRGQTVSMDEYVTEDVEAVEIYSGAARVPLEYGGTGAACGVIAIWRRNGR